MGAVYTMIILFSRKIRRPVNKLTNYTHLMNQAQDREDKIKVVKNVKRDEAFSEIALEYEAAEFVKKFPDATKKQDAFKKSFRKADTVLIEDLNKGQNGETLVTRSKM